MQAMKQNHISKITPKPHLPKLKNYKVFIKKKKQNLCVNLPKKKNQPGQVSTHCFHSSAQVDDRVP